MLEYLDAGDHLRGFLAHQQIVGGDIGFALGAIDDQRTNGLRGRCGQLHRSRKARAAEATDSGFADDVQQLGRWQLAVVRSRLQLGPFVVTVGFDDNGGGEHP